MIDKKQIKKIAYLAKLEIADEELDSYEAQISKILAYMDQLNEVDTDGLDEFSNKLFSNKQQLREDVKEESLDRDDVTKIAPNSDGVYIKVPSVIDEKK
ncbi:MAG: Asp-tRNA(Asn)/Glu-tRNA(Gln) amidotransferase GatCAB subunit C [Candidatus Marinimicrobia bacterium]|nr:Asp-tRNA(Asn)/Glu-tRNA(Gln) amidotransferase GatCAB subunit C [Candidatus Neomarinimicrobiota bacterium]|tara:strand:+ start:1942 stop:2238 length:297 start_codon:yes stop_codon:yes gene_type:complete